MILFEKSSKYCLFITPWSVICGYCSIDYLKSSVMSGKKTQSQHSCLWLRGWRFYSLIGYLLLYKAVAGRWLATALQAFGFPTSLYGLDIGYCGSESKDCMHEGTLTQTVEWVGPYTSVALSTLHAWHNSKLFSNFSCFSSRWLTDYSNKLWILLCYYISSLKLTKSKNLFEFSTVGIH